MNEHKITPDTPPVTATDRPLRMMALGALAEWGELAPSEVEERSLGHDCEGGEQLWRVAVAPHDSSLAFASAADALAVLTHICACASRRGMIQGGLDWNGSPFYLPPLGGMELDYSRRLVHDGTPDRLFRETLDECAALMLFEYVYALRERYATPIGHSEGEAPGA